VKISCFEDIIAWQKGQDLAVNIYAAFKETTEYDFKRQIFRAAISVSNNIAEGYERGSNADFRRFLYISMASNSEVKSMLYLAKRLSFLSDTEFQSLYDQTNEISKLIKGFIKSIPEKNN
jgi:four helix bundle protein